MDLNINEYSTHLPVLIEAVKAVDSKKVLELGCGDGSTPVLKSMELDLTTLESDKEWGKKHGAIWVDDWAGAYKKYSKEEWGVVFIDNSPWETRLDAIKAFKDKAIFIVLHDTDYYTEGQGIDFSNDFRFLETFYPPDPWPATTGPPVMLMSNVRDCNLSEIVNDYKYVRV